MNVAERHQRFAILSRAAPSGRGARFARRIAHAPALRFSDMAKVPNWLDETPEARVRIAALAALLKHRAALDAELSGSRLGMIAAAVGEDLLDAACEMPVLARGPAGPLPPPDRIVAEGEKLLEAGLPLPFIAGFPGARDDESARGFADQAHRIARALA
jgi:hypothetical protein